MNKDREILRGLGAQWAEVAALPVQAEKRALWTQNNDLRPLRPMVIMDQLPWGEIDRSDEMRLLCEDAYLRSVEHALRGTLYRWNHFPCDMVIERHFDVPKTVSGLNYGIHVREETLAFDPANDVVSHRYEDQLSTLADVDALAPDRIESDPQLDQRHMDQLSDIFRGVLPLRLSGVQIHLGVWDRIAQMRPAESILWDIADDPDLIVATVKKFAALTQSTVDQCRRLGLLDAGLQTIHCTGAYTSDLPGTALEGEATPKDCWAFGMAQIFSTVSPAMHDALEIELMRPLYEQFGLMYYGCCEPLHDRIDRIRKIKNVRKISVSPWANPDISAEQMGRDYVFSCKPNPAFIAGGFDADSIKAQFERALCATRRQGTPAEFILKDVSTVGGRLDRWGRLAMGLVGG